MGRLQPGVNDLLTWCQNNGEWGQKLINEWVGEDEEGNHIEMNNIAKASNKKVRWVCSIDSKHKWVAYVNDRTHTTISKRTGCPFCSGRALSDNTHLGAWCDMNGEYGNNLRNEWTGKDENGNYWNIEDVHSGKNRLRFLWRCDSGHEWYTAIVHRTLRKSGCPYCSKRGTSYAEQLLYWSLKYIYSNCKNRNKNFKESIRNGLEYDVSIYDIDTYIEYSPERTHKDKEKQDMLKYDMCIKNGIRFIYISDKFTYDTASGMHILDNRDNICMVNNTLKILGHSIDELDMREVENKAYKYSRIEIEKEKQLVEIHPNIKNEINTKLSNIDIAKLTVGTHIKVYWTCSKCGHGDNGEWYSRVIDRTGKLSGCPACGWNIFKNEYIVNATSTCSAGYNDLSTVYPELAKEVHPNNDRKPTEIRANSHKQVTWLCNKCKHSWDANPHSRIGNKSGCPKCGWNWYEQRYKKIHSKVKIGLPDKNML